MKKNLFGFSLIELLVVLAIIAILASISWPLYTEHLIKTRRAQAKVALMQLSSRLERYAMTYHSYQGATLNNLGLPSLIANDYYRLQIISISSDHYEIAAIPQKNQTQDRQCGTLMFNQNGQQRISGTEKVTYCW